MDQDLQLVGLCIAFVVGFGMVKGSQKRELQELGRLVGLASTVLTFAHLANRFGSA